MSVKGIFLVDSAACRWTVWVDIAIHACREVTITSFTQTCETWYFHTWKEQGCPLRALIAIMSYGGIWHNALVYDKVLRAAVDPKGGGLSMEELQEAAVKRLCLENRAKGQDFQGVETIFNK